LKNILPVDSIINQDYDEAAERPINSGFTYWTWGELMPRIDLSVLNCAVYLYASAQDAKQGEKSGGSGFLVGVRYEGGGFIYAVTNSHVIREGKAPIVRLNKEKDVPYIGEYTQDMWIHHPDGDDLAIVPLDVEAVRARLNFVSTEIFITKDIIQKERIGAGDDVFMVGRFIGYDGKQQNEPTVRFGNLSISSPVPITHPRGSKQESFLIETRSLAGYSGSPVFVHILPMSLRAPSGGWAKLQDRNWEDNNPYMYRGPWLLGVDWGHKHYMETVREKNGEDEIAEGWKVPVNSGITCVVPAWKLLELLNIDEVAQAREDEYEKVKKQMLKEQRLKEDGGVSLDSPSN